MPNEKTARVFKGDFCGVKEIAEFANVSKAQVAHWLETDWFPKPLDGPAMGNVWDYKKVVEVLTDRGYPKPVGADGRRLTRRKYRFDSVPVEQ